MSGTLNCLGTFAILGMECDINVVCVGIYVP